MKRFLLSLIAALLAAPVFAQTWPGGGPITIIMGFPAGSGVDIVARLFQVPMEQALGARFVMDYRTGAGGNIASEAVARARPDGYTILLSTAATHGVNAALYKRLAFDVENDFTPIAPMVDVSNVLTINTAIIDAHSVKEFISMVKANPGKYNFASTGNGTGTHLAFADFNSRAALNMVHVPYKGGPEALAAVVKGDVCCIFNQVQSVLGQWKAGKVRLLGVTTKARVAAVPDIPTISEAGVPGYESYIWFGLHGPKGLDPQIVSALNAAVKKAVETPSVRQRLAELGNTPRYETPEQFKATIKADRASWALVVKASGASVD